MGYGESIGDMFYNVRADFTQAENDLKSFESKQTSRNLLIRIGIDFGALDSEIKKLDEKIGSTRTIKILIDTAAAEEKMRGLEGKFGGRFAGATGTTPASMLQMSSPNITGTSNGDVSMSGGRFSNPISTSGMMANVMAHAAPAGASPTAPSPTSNPDLMAWARNPTMQAAYRGNPDAIGRQLADKLGVGVDDVQEAMSGRVGGSKSITTASPLTAARVADFHASDVGDRGGDEQDVRRYRSSTSAAFAPLGHDEGRRSVFSHNDSLVRNLGLDALDESIPGQMRQSGHNAEVMAGINDEIGDATTSQAAGLAPGVVVDGEGGGGGAGGKGSFLTRPLGLRGLRYTGAGLAISGGIGIANAYHAMQVQERLAGSNQDEVAEAAIKGTQSMANAFPIVGGIAMAGADFLGQFAKSNSPLWMGGNSADNEATVEEGRKQDAISESIRQGKAMRRGANFQIQSLSGHQDPFTLQRTAIAGELDQAKIDAAQVGFVMRQNGATSEVSKAEIDRRTDSATQIAAAKSTLNDRNEKLTVGTMMSQAIASDKSYSGNSLGASLEQFSGANFIAALNNAPNTPEARDALSHTFANGVAQTRRDFTRGTGDVVSNNASASMRLQGLDYEANINDIRGERDRTLRDINPNAGPEEKARYDAQASRFNLQEQAASQQEGVRRNLFGVDIDRMDNNSENLRMRAQHKYSSASMQGILSGAGSQIDALNAQGPLAGQRAYERNEKISAIQGNAAAQLGLLHQDIEDRFEQGTAQQSGSGITRGQSGTRKEIQSMIDDLDVERKTRNISSASAMIQDLDGGAMNSKAGLPGGSGAAASGGGDSEVKIDGFDDALKLFQQIATNTAGGPKAS